MIVLRTIIFGKKVDVAPQQYCIKIEPPAPQKCFTSPQKTGIINEPKKTIIVVSTLLKMQWRGWGCYNYTSTRDKKQALSKKQ